MPGEASEVGSPGSSGALALLFYLRFRASLRRMRRSVATRKGMVFAAVGLVVLFFWFGPLLAQGFLVEARDPAAIRGFVPYAIVFLLFMALLTSMGERAIYFSPAEVNLLFSGPFSRRQLVLYKIAGSAMGIMVTSLFFGLFLFPQVGSFPAAYLGAFAALLLVQLTSMFMVMLGERAGQQLTTRVRWCAGIGLVALIGSGVVAAAGSLDIEDPQGILEAVRSGAGARLLEGALSPFTWTMTAPNLGVLGLAFAGTMAINGGMIGVILLLDANYLETAAGVSERIYANMRRAQRRGVAAVNPNHAGRRVPRLPHWGGLGTVAWRQMATARRSSLGTVVMLLVVAVGIGVVVSSGVARAQMWVVSISMVFWLTLILSGVLRFDFRGDLDVLETLKAMPLRPFAVAGGQIVVPSVVLTVIQAVALTVPLTVQGYAAYLPLVVLFALPINGLLYAIENLLFLLYPVRLQGQNAADFSFFGRQVLVFLVKIIVIGGCLALAGLAGVVVVLLGALSQAWLGVGVGPSGTAAAGFFAAWLVLCVELIVLLPYLGWAFQRFDPSQDLPE